MSTISQGEAELTRGSQTILAYTSGPYPLVREPERFRGISASLTNTSGPLLVEKKRQSGTGILKKTIISAIFSIPIVMGLVALAINITTESALAALEIEVADFMENLTARYTDAKLDYDALNIAFTIFENNAKQLALVLENPVQQLLTPCVLIPASSPSGYYWTRSSNGSIVRVYCDMTRSCGGITGGWMRVGFLDMTNTTRDCPDGFSKREDSHTCVTTEQFNRGCKTITLPTFSRLYSRVCGRISAYQIGSTEAFTHKAAASEIGAPYLDGVSLSHGGEGSVAVHIWSFAAALDETGDPSYRCKCNGGTSTPLPFIKETDYFCDSTFERYVEGMMPARPFLDRPLWDGAGCGPENSCCSFNNPPWFHKMLPESTSNDIEMRVCRDDLPNHEDIALEGFEIYVQ